MIESGKLVPKSARKLQKYCLKIAAISSVMSIIFQ
jgi:hypothetical protein